MNTAINALKIVIGAAAAVFGSLAIADGLPMSWHKGVMIGLSVATALSQFTKQIGATAAQAPAEPEKK